MSRAVAQLRAAFTEHVSVTEGESGLYAGLLEHAPRLARGVTELVDEHRAVISAFNALQDKLEDNFDACVEEVRQQAEQLLREMWQHRQRGADLVYEAYATDIGGET
jgi:archaellum component FlaC